MGKLLYGDFPSKFAINSRLRVCINRTDTAYELYPSYNTVANGQSDAIVCQPHMALILRSKGGASDFATWEEVSIATALDIAYEKEWDIVEVEDGKLIDFFI